MINHIPPSTAKTDALTSLLRSDLPDLGEIEVTLHETAATRSGEADSLTHYLNEAARWPRLDAQEELALGHRIKAGQNADGTLNPAGQAAFDELVKCNLRLTYYVAKKINVSREEMFELVAAGNVALMESARTFNADLGHRFSTYAVWGIRSAVFRHLNFLRRTVRLPRNLHEQMAKLRKAEEAILQKTGCEATEAELTAALQWSPEKIAELRTYQQHGQSLDAPIGEDGNTTFGDTLADAEASTPAAYAEAADRQAALAEVMAQLTPRELEVIRARAGLDGEEQTLDAIGRRHGVSRERIRQIEAEAFRKMRVGIRR